MDPLDFQTDEELSDLFHRKKTEISSMEEPQAFLIQLRDYNLVPEDLYQKVMKMESKERRQEGVYQILDQLEKKAGHCYRLFWRCVFQDHILQKYTVLRLLRNSLIESVQKEEKTGEEMKRGLKRKKSFEKTDEEKPGPSTRSTSQQKKPALLLKEGEKQDDWSSIRFKQQLPVMCGDKEGILHKEKLARGDKCIQSEGSWFTTGDFEKFAGKESSKNWKVSIRYEDTPLKTLIEKGYLKAQHANKRSVKKKVQLTDTSTETTSSSGSSSLQSTSNVEPVELGKEEGDDKKEEEEEEGENDPVDLLMFEAPSLPVSCGSFCGVLYKNRFTGPHSKSIRTEERWFTPEEFVNQESTLTDAHWRKDILCHGKTLHYLVKKEILLVHSLLCDCVYCHYENSNNDDFCYICNDNGDLVCCEKCPRVFHKNCHLPNLQNETLGDEWTCTFCKFKAEEPSLPLTKEDLPLSKAIMYCEYLLLHMYKEDKKQVFTGDSTATDTVKMESRMNEIFKKEIHKIFNIFSHVGLLTYNDSRQMNWSPSNPLDILEDKNETSSMGVPENFCDKLQNHSQNVTGNSQLDVKPSTSRTQLEMLTVQDLNKEKQIASDPQLELTKLQTTKTRLQIEMLEYKLKKMKKLLK